MVPLDCHAPMNNALAGRLSGLALTFNLALLAAPAVSLAWMTASPWGAAVGLTLSALLLVVLLLLVRNWRAFFLLHLPLLALAPAFVVYVLEFGAPPNEGAIAVVLTSSLREFWAFLAAFELRPWAALWLVLLALYLLGALALGRRAVPAALRRVVARAILPLLVAGLCMPSRSDGGMEVDVGGNVARSLTSSYPLGGLFSVVGGLMGNAEVWGFFEERPPFGAVAAARGPETHILVIGEAARADRFQLFGYARPTTPRLAALDGLVAFDRMFAAGNLTMLSVPMLMTGTDAVQYEPKARRGNLIDLAREAGFYTGLITNQELWIYKLFHPRPDRWRQASDSIGWGDRHAIPDTSMLPALDEMLSAESPKKFVVLHSYGSHWDYAQRLPDDGFHFSGPDRAAAKRALETGDKNRQYDALYDDTIRETDRFLAAIIERAARLPGLVSVTYVPDHGEALPSSEGANTHGFRTFYVSELNVPLLVWGNAEFRRVAAERWSWLQRHRGQICGHDATFHTLSALMAIDFAGHDPSRDLGSPSYRAPRLDALRFRISPSAELRSLHDAADWPRSCARLGGC